MGAVFCTADRLALGPFTSGKKLSAFKALACLLDSNLDGVFEAVTFIGFFSAREAGPVAMKPLAYQGYANVGNIDQSRFDALQKLVWLSTPPLSKEEEADWDWCPKGSGFESLDFSADRKLALAHGGWQSGPLAGGWGDCYYEKVGEE